MRIHIVHQSSTGNTLLGAEAMAAEFEAAGHQCVLSRVRDTEHAGLTEADVVGVATAVYGFAPARNMLRFIDSMPELPGKPAFVLCCCSVMPANSVRTVWKRLEKKGMRVLGGQVLIGEDSWPFLRLGSRTPGLGEPSEAGLAAVREFAMGILGCAESVDGARAAPPRWWPNPCHFIGLAATWQVLRLIMLGKRVNPDRCTRCGKCAEVCPTGALSMGDLPTFSKQCMGCFACINNCPERAISCPISWGRSLYQGPGIRSGE